MKPTEWDKLMKRLLLAVNGYYEYRRQALAIPPEVSNEFFAALDAVQKYRDGGVVERAVTVKINPLLFN